VEGDIADTALVGSLLKRVDAVMHFAASAYVGESMVNPRKYFSNNIEKALLLLDAVIASDVRMFVFSSTCLDTIVRTAFEWEERLPSYLKQG